MIAMDKIAIIATSRFVRLPNSIFLCFRWKFFLYVLVGSS
ncbi:WSSV608 [White spot syndrome virus]|uniref:WSSV608 n=1 Tax=White spot syndrome virus TaxID=342409 RepID=A0A2I6SCM6_9VIRU|nr:WSSV608 [White spot syndrome virus]